MSTNLPILHLSTEQLILLPASTAALACSVSVLWARPIISVPLSFVYWSLFWLYVYWNESCIPVSWVVRVVCMSRRWCVE